jgi:riboflavin kinase / FMN adenylyltransferase
MTKSSQPAIVTIGNFDGVHIGHQMLIHQVADRARALGLCSLAVTFEPHPEQVLFPERKLTHLSSPEERMELLRANGMDDVWICPFTTDLARMEPEDFLRLVSERQPIAELWVGADFALGRGRRGTISVLAEIGSGRGWGIHVVPPYMLEGQIVSSTAIRTLLAAGAVRGVADLLGRTYSVPGMLHDSELDVNPLRALPKPMVYEAQVRQDGQSYDAPVTVLSNTDARLRIDAEVPCHDGPAVIDFIRRAD